MNAVVEYIRGLFKVEKSVSQVMSSFTKTINELREIETAAADRAWDIEEKINNLRVEQAAQDKESSKAGELAEKLEAIFK